MKIFESYSEAETLDFAKGFAAELKEGDIVALSGDLGAGKTAFVKGIAKGLGVCEDVTSPTFTIVNQYDGDMPLFHFDAYRLENISPDQCDWMDDYFFADGVCLIEWAANIQSILPNGYIRVTINKNPDKGDDYREIIIEK